MSRSHTIYCTILRKQSRLNGGHPQVRMSRCQVRRWKEHVPAAHLRFSSPECSENWEQYQSMHTKEWTTSSAFSVTGPIATITDKDRSPQEANAIIGNLVGSSTHWTPLEVANHHECDMLREEIYHPPMAALRESCEH